MNKLDFNKTVTTRDGREVKIFTTEARNPAYPVIGEYKNSDGVWDNIRWSIRGEYRIGSLGISDYDLINPPEEKWINVYPSGGGNVHSTKEVANKEATGGRIACIKFTEGEGL